MSNHMLGRPSYLAYGLLVVLLIGSFVLLNGFQADHSATMAPNLTLIR